MKGNRYAGFSALDPFFQVIQEGLKGLVDGEHYFDFLTDNVTFDFMYRFPGYPSHVEGRDDLIALYRGYGDTLTLERMSGLVVHRTVDPSVVILEYSSHGHGTKTGLPYNNHYISVVTIENRKIIGWRDYLDPLTVLTTLGVPAPIIPD